MNNNKILDRINQIEAFADLIKEHVIVLKKELEGGGASESSARKGKALPEKEIAKILAQRQKTRMKKK
jgi:hypothetical protein